MERPRPLEIIGGGLAGLALGTALGREGVPVTLCEAGRYPRHRVCGEFITGLPRRTIDRLGLEPALAGALPHRSIVWHRGGRVLRRQTLPEPALGLSRHRLDERLAQAFEAAGGQLRCDTRRPAAQDAPGRIFATGRRPGQAGWLGLKVHARHLPLRGDLELHLGADAYVGASGVEEGRVNVCGLFRRRSLQGRGLELFFAYLRAAGLGELADRVAAGSPDPASFCAVASVGFDRRPDQPDRCRLGDGWAAIPPFTGHGMAMAFQSAELALDPLLAYARGSLSWEAARRAVDRALRARFRVRLASAALLHRHLLRAPGQPWLAALARAQLLPLRPLYALLH